MLCIPHAIELNADYFMQIIGIKYEKKPFQRGRDTFTFDVRIWPDRDNPDDFVEVKERFYDGGSAEKYLMNFIEAATDGVYGDTSSDEMLGATFIGRFTSNVKGAKKYFNLRAIEHIGYSDFDVYETADTADEMP